MHGGIVGNLSGNKDKNAEFSECTNYGEVKGENFAGGIIGNYGFGNTVIKNCYNTGNVSASAVSGGILGESAGRRLEYNYSFGYFKLF